MVREKYSQTTKEIKIENGERKIQLDNERKREWRKKNTARQRMKEKE